MGWYNEPDIFECNDCNHEFEFIADTLFIASNGGLPIKCPKCKSEDVSKKTNNE